MLTGGSVLVLELGVGRILSRGAMWEIRESPREGGGIRHGIHMHRLNDALSGRDAAWWVLPFIYSRESGLVLFGTRDPGAGAVRKTPQEVMMSGPRWRV